MKDGRRRSAVGALGAYAVGAYLKVALATVRWRLDDRGDGMRALRTRGCVVAFWHETLPGMPALARRLRRLETVRRPIHVLISRHRDGRFISRIIRRFDLETVHGSSARVKDGRTTGRGGAAAFRRLAQLLETGAHVVLTPDGPRGPAHEAKAGLVALARAAAAPIVPCAAVTRPEIRLPSWDRMRLPVPFARGVVVVGSPFEVPSGSRAEALAIAEAALTAVLRHADARLGRPVTRNG